MLPPRIGNRCISYVQGGGGRGGCQRHGDFLVDSRGTRGIETQLAKYGRCNTAAAVAAKARFLYYLFHVYSSISTINNSVFPLVFSHDTPYLHTARCCSLLYHRAPETRPAGGPARSWRSGGEHLPTNRGRATARELPIPARQFQRGQAATYHCGIAAQASDGKHCDHRLPRAGRGLFCEL